MREKPCSLLFASIDAIVVSFLGYKVDVLFVGFFNEVWKSSCHHLQMTGGKQILLWIRAIHSVSERLSVSSKASPPAHMEQQPQNHWDSPGFPECRKEAEVYIKVHLWHSCRGAESLKHKWHWLWSLGGICEIASSMFKEY